MDTIIGLGAAGCRIADEFAKYPQYDIYKIDVGLTGQNCFAMPQKSSPEDYEKNAPDLSEFFSKIEGEVLFIVGGGGKISGATLQILKQLQHCSLNILYIKPYERALTKTGSLQNRVAFHVLQEYARSGIFKNIFLVDNTVLEKLVGDVSILEYNIKLNSLIVNAFHAYNSFMHLEPIMQNMEPAKDIFRITTLGVYDTKENSETLFFPLQNSPYKCYYYAVPETVLKNDGKLFKAIKDKVAEDQSSYQIHVTKHEETYCYLVAQTNLVQTLDNN